MNHVYKKAEIAALRRRLALTQVEFADLMGISKRTLEAWEAGRQVARGSGQALLFFIDAHYTSRRGQRAIRKLKRGAPDVCSAAVAPLEDLVIARSLPESVSNGFRVTGYVLRAPDGRRWIAESGHPIAAEVLPKTCAASLDVARANAGRRTSKAKQTRTKKPKKPDERKDNRTLNLFDS